MSGYAIWQYVHILLFVYWLGADLGVFFAARYVARADLPTPERLRFLELLLTVDMGPRTALILMVPVGFVLATQLGLTPFAAPWLPLIWIVAVAWLALTWRLFWLGRDPRAQSWTRIDYWLRVVVAALFVSLGLTSLATSRPVPVDWLAVKMLLFGIVVVLGLLLRTTIRDWAVGFERLRDPGQVETGNALIRSAYRRATRLAHTLWLLIAIIALLGVTKPSWLT
ncbi:MAG: hypothetical protein NZM12_11265 [Steroidobacteraceae bacterium]|nr:hypothetical protein [Steroidobacteraceae bacterium]MDW8257900.1 hypothetical protein [Gammaproteobacteria bacterium]